MNDVERGHEDESEEDAEFEEDAELPDALVDTSVAVALALAGHVHHSIVLTSTADLTLGLAGHAAYESYSVLTRLPPPERQSPAAVRRLLDTNFPVPCPLPAGAQRMLWGCLTERHIAGGAVYDALVSAAAAHYALPLITLDHRALATYRAFGIETQLLV